jgi:hypothetical protein
MDRPRNAKRWIPVILAVAVVACSSGGAVELPEGYWSKKQSDAILDKTLRLHLDPDVSYLNPAEKETVEILLEAGGIIQKLYENSLHHQAEEAYQNLLSLHSQKEAGATQNLLDLYRIFDGPIGRNLDGKPEPFLPVDGEVPGANVYPWAVTKDEIEGYLERHPERRRSLLHPRAVVRRATRENIDRDRAMLDRYPVLRAFHDDLDVAVDPEGFYACPYSIAYAEELTRVSTLLKRAADVIEDTDIAFARYLRHRSIDLLRDDYEAGDAAWVTGRFGNLNAQVGSYEVYDDDLFSVKTFFSVSVLVKDAAMSESLKTVLRWLQEFENSLPYEHHKTVRTDIPVGVYYVAADFGQARGTNTATILPNEAYITRKYGRTILLRRNILENKKIFKVREDAFDAAVAKKFHENYTAEGDFYRTLFHEIGHYLGVDQTRDGRTLGDALEEDSSILEELKADLVSLYLAKQLHKKGYYSDDRLRSVQAAGVRRTLRKNKPRKSQVYATMQLMQMNYYLEKGSLTYDAKENRLKINTGTYHQAVESMLREVLELQYQGNKDAADAFIDRYATWNEELQGKIARSMKDAETYRYALVRYGALGE